MSRSEKRRYYRPAPVFALDSHLLQLEQCLAALDKEAQIVLLKEYALVNRTSQFVLVGRYVPLSGADVFALLKGQLMEKKYDDEYLDDFAQTEIAKSGYAILERAKELVAADDYALALDLCIATLLAIEPVLSWVSDEGWTYQMVLISTFEWLATVASQPLDPAIRTDLRQRLVQAAESIRDDDRYVPDKWKTIITAFE